MDSIQINNKYKAEKKETKKKTKRYTYTEVQKDVVKRRLSSKPKVKKTPEKKLKAILLELVLIWGKIKNTDSMGKGFCCTCMLFDYWWHMSWWHFIPQSRGLSCKFELDNINLQCAGCNGKWNQGEQYKHWLYVDRTYGAGRADELHQQGQSLKRWKRWELEEAITEVEDKIVALCGIMPQSRVNHLLTYIKKDGSRKSNCKNLLIKLGYGK